MIPETQKTNEMNRTIDLAYCLKKAPCHNTVRGNPGRARRQPEPERAGVWGDPDSWNS